MQSFIFLSSASATIKSKIKKKGIKKKLKKGVGFKLQLKQFASIEFQILRQKVLRGAPL